MSSNPHEHENVENKLCPHKHQHTSCCLGDAFKIPLQNPSHCDGSHVHKVFETHVIDTTGGKDDVGTGCQDFLDSFLGDVRLSEKEKNSIKLKYTSKQREFTIVQPTEAEQQLRGKLLKELLQPLLSPTRITV